MNKSLLLLAVLVLSGCVTTPSGEKKFNPWQAAERADESIDAWLDRDANAGLNTHTLPPPPAN